MSKNVYLFSGQGCQYTGMAKELYEKYNACREIFAEADKVFDFNLKDICFNAPAEELAKTIYSQPAIFATSLCALVAAKTNNIQATAVAGHSLGEYAAMVASGILTVREGFEAIKIRSEAMQKASETSHGAMCAIIGLDAVEVEKVCEGIDGYVIPVNYNSKVQTVIAGDCEAVDKAIEVFASQKARAIKLNVSSAFHSKLMKSASEEFYNKSADIDFKKPHIEFYTNLTGDMMADDVDMRDYLAKHIISPVKFTTELTNLYNNGYDTFIELGPNKVLTGLVKKTLKGVTAINIENNATLEKAVSALNSEE